MRSYRALTLLPVLLSCLAVAAVDARNDKPIADTTQFTAGRRVIAANLTADTLSTTGATRIGELRSAKLWPDSTKVVFKDTTLAISAKRIVGVNLHDPAQVWDYDKFRAAEKQTSLVQVDRKRVPDLAALVVSAGADSLSIVDLSAPSTTRVRVYKDSTNSPLDIGAINGVSFIDGIANVAQTGALTKLDILGDGAVQWTTAGQYVYKAPLATRGAGYSLQTSSPAIVNSTVNAVAAIRSPWARRLDGHRDALGRAVQYWVAGTQGGLSATSYNASGTLAIYDGFADSTNSVYLSLKGREMNIFPATTGAYMHWYRDMFRLAADGNTCDVTFSGTAAEAKKWRWAAPTKVRSVALLEGASSGGNNSPTSFVGSDSGLVRFDLKATDESNGSVQEINARYVSPVMPGKIAVAFSGASSADVSGMGHPWRAFNSVSYVTGAASPGGVYGLTNANDECWTISDNTDLTFTTEMSVGTWVYPTNNITAAQGIMNKYDSNAGADRSWYLRITAGDSISFAVNTSSIVVSTTTTAIAYNSWYFVVGTYDGTTQRLYVNGILVDSDAQTGNVVDSTEPMALGCLTADGAPAPSNPCLGRYWGAFASADVMSSSQIAVAYQQGVRMMQSPTPDTLMANNVLRVKVQPYTGNVMLVHPGSVEIRDRWGALSDTFACADCGTLADGDFLRVAGVDSLGGGIFFGGATKSRVIAPDPKLWDAANYRYPYEPYEITMPAIVDSAGGGHFWTIQDAISAMSNVGRVFARIARGTYPNPITTVPTGAVLEGSGIKTVISNASDTSKVALTIAGDSVIVRDLAVRTTSNGAGGGKDAISLTGDGIRMEQVSVLDADNNAINIASGSDRDALVDVSVSAADNYGLTSAGRELQVRGGRYYGALRGMYLNGRRSQIEGTAITAGVANDTTLSFAAGADSTLFLGNDVRGHITVGTGDTATTLIGNNRLNAGKITDYGTGTRAINNTGSATDTNKVVQPTKIGTADNHTMTDANGHQWMVGLARPWRDERNDALSIKNTGNKVTESLVNGTLDFATDADTSHYAIVNVQLNHDRDLTSVISPHIHWLQTENASPHWVVGYRWIKQGARFDSLAATTQWEFVKCGTLVTAYSAGSVHQISEMADITPPAGSAISDIVQFRILRDTADKKTKWGSSDTYSTAVSMLAFDVHIQLNSLGSSSEYIK